MKIINGIRCVVLSLAIACSLAAVGQPLEPLKEALRAEKWIRSSRIVKSQGIAWPVVPGDTIITTNLYSGTTGIVLFYLELYHATSDKSFLAEAKGGADYIMAVGDKRKPGYEELGLYTGEAGVVYTLNKVFEVTHEKKYKDGADRSFERLTKAAKISGVVADWRFNDIVYGGAGIGLMLLQMSDKKGLPLAIQTGNGLLAHSLDAEGGKKWYMDTAMVRQQYYMPNFSHGTAGVGYYLARLYQESGKKEFLNGALAAANHLKSIVNTDAWIYHHDNEEGKGLYYLSWCHGPAGTARFYYLLYQLTGDESWKSRIKTAAGAMMTCGIPQKQLPGFWNNVSTCCGSASVASFFLDLYELFGDEQYLNFSREMTRSLLAKSTPEADGVKWIQAEHRRHPEFVQAQTGMMQGAAGIGLWLLRLNAFEKKTKRLVRLPDDPF